MYGFEHHVAELTDADDRVSAVTASLEELRHLAHAFRSAGQRIPAAQAFRRLAAASHADWLAQHNAGAVSLEATELGDAATHLQRACDLHPNADSYQLLGHVLALRGEMLAARAAYEDAVRLEPANAEANWGLFEVLQLLGDNAGAVHHQRIALGQRSLRTTPARVQPARTTILELCIAGTFQANIPLDFILDLDRTTVHKLYLGEHPIPQLPPYDIIFNTIADAPNAHAALAAAQTFIGQQARPALNAPQFIPLTARDAIYARFKLSNAVAVAATVQANRAEIPTLQHAYPFLIRPLDSHAGNDLAKIDTDAELQAYLDRTPHADDFYLSEFIDYRNADGYFRKYRIVFVDGVPYPVHLAISPRWMIHYYNAPMADNQWMRDEEHAFMRDMSAVFDGIRAEGLREIARAIPLDYFGIDCSIAADGRVLLFEASSAMIVHMRDPVDLYPYKAQYVPRIVRALERLFDDRLHRTAAT